MRSLCRLICENETEFDATMRKQLIYSLFTRDYLIYLSTRKNTISGDGWLLLQLNCIRLQAESRFAGWTELVALSLAGGIMYQVCDWLTCS